MSPALSMQLSMPVLACSCLPGEIYRKGVGVSLVLFLKKEPQNINAWTESGGVQRPREKGRGSGQRWQMGATPSSKVRGKSFLQETSVMPGQMPTHVYGQDSTHVPTHV